MMRKKGLLVFCFFMGMLWMTSCKQPVAPDYYGVESITITKIGLNESRVDANVKFYNPNHFKLQLKQADVNILVEGKFVGHCLIDSTIYIPKLDSFYIPASVNIDLKNIMGNAVQLLLNGRVRIQAEGFVKLKKDGIGFKVPVHYEQYQQLDELLQQIH
jgi:LEA14-like dessication related protein